VERGGKWESLREEWGFPGGTPRWMAVDLRGLLRKGDRRLKVETDMEVYFDHAAVVEAERIDLGEIGRRAGARTWESHGVRITACAPSRGDLRYLGFPRDSSPDGKHPKVYDHDDVGAETMKPFPGRYTRYGDVSDLVGGADDRLAVMGEGDEVVLGFAADALPPLPEGWKRTFFLGAVGYCKDMDLYTAGGDRVEPLPYRAMASYPPPEPSPAARERDDREVAPLTSPGSRQ
jgi:hypothetical protein